jgi:hypothetical protein
VPHQDDRRVPLARWTALVGALVLLNLALAFENVWPTLGIRLGWRLSLDALLLVLVLAVTAGRGWTTPPRSRRLLAVAVVVLIVGHYVETTTRSLYGRSVNLYWDLKLMPDVGSMFAYVAQPAVLAAFIAGLVVVPALLYLPARWVAGVLLEACARPAPRRFLLVVSLAGLAAGTARLAQAGADPPGEVARPVTLAIARTVVEFVREASGLTHQPLPPAPNLANDLSRVQGADVVLLFVESYGVTSWQRPEFRQALAPLRADLTRAIAETGRAVVTGVVESTTFGGESWLAHISLLSGTEVRNPDVNMRLMTERRDTMVTTFANAGYRTVAVMPGLKVPWPEGRFYGFHDIFGAADLDYQGPPFSWWDVTDQFVIARMDERVLTPANRPPAFVFLPTISTHTPFTPVPPYQPDWSRMLTPTPYDPEPLMAAYDAQPDWTNLGPDYARALAYAHQTISGYLRLRADRDLVLILIGDHQPPALVSGEGAAWDVPVHVITSRAAILDRLRAAGFGDGLEPGSRLARMDTLLPILLDAFGNPR